EEFDYEGRFYKIVRGVARPMPIQRPFPAIMNAGASETGRHVAAKHADMAFVALRSTSDFDIGRDQLAAYRDLARTDYGRDIQVWTHSYVIQRETRVEAIK